MPTEDDWAYIGEGLARCLDATCQTITAAIGEAGSHGPRVLGAITDWLEVNGGARPMSVVRSALDIALEGPRR